MMTTQSIDHLVTAIVTKLRPEVQKIIDERASLRKQLDEARERESQMAAALRDFACDLSHWKDDHHDCDCPPGSTGCGCHELRSIIQTAEFFDVSPASPSPVLRDADTAPAPDKCASCGHPRKEHTYNGACYGLCGEFTAPAPAISGGMVNVPREPTEAMLDAMEQWVGSHGICRRRAWLAALAAADRSAS